LSRRIIRIWISLEKPRDIPWTPLDKPLNQYTVALISSAGMALATDKPFDQEVERQNPWLSDPSFRVIPLRTTARDILVYHLHINSSSSNRTSKARCRCSGWRNWKPAARSGARRRRIIPLSAIPASRTACSSVPAIISKLREEEVDVVALVPI
jgi:hypothetical protein